MVGYTWWLQGKNCSTTLQGPSWGRSWLMIFGSIRCYRRPWRRVVRNKNVSFKSRLPNLESKFALRKRLTSKSITIVDRVSPEDGEPLFIISSVDILVQYTCLLASRYVSFATWLFIWLFSLFFYFSRPSSLLCWRWWVQEWGFLGSPHTTRPLRDSDSVRYFLLSTLTPQVVPSTLIFLRVRIVLRSTRMRGAFYLHWKSIREKIVLSPNCTEVESCADGLGLRIVLNTCRWKCLCSWNIVA